MLFNIFKRKKKDQSENKRNFRLEAKPPWIGMKTPEPEEAKQIYHKIINNIWDNLRGIQQSEKPQKYDHFIEQIIKYMINLPASSKREFHHCKTFGLLEHTLEVALYSVIKIKNDPIIIRKKTDNTPDKIETDKQAPLNNLMIFIAAIAHDFGKVADVEIKNVRGEIWDYNKISLQDWLIETGSEDYHFKWKEDRAGSHVKNSIFFINKIMPKELLSELGMERWGEITEYLNGKGSKDNQCYKYVHASDKKSAKEYKLRKSVELDDQIIIDTEVAKEDLQEESESKHVSVEKETGTEGLKEIKEKHEKLMQKKKTDLQEESQSDLATEGTEDTELASPEKERGGNVKGKDTSETESIHVTENSSTGRKGPETIQQNVGTERASPEKEEVDTVESNDTGGSESKQFNKVDQTKSIESLEPEESTQSTSRPTESTTGTQGPQDDSLSLEDMLEGAEEEEFRHEDSIVGAEARGEDLQEESQENKATEHTESTELTTSDIKQGKIVEGGDSSESENKHDSEDDELKAVESGDIHVTENPTNGTQGPQNLTRSDFVEDNHSEVKVVEPKRVFKEDKNNSWFKNYDIKEEFKEGFRIALSKQIQTIEKGGELTELFFNNRSGNIWVGEEYTLLLSPNAIRAIYNKNIDNIKLCPGCEGMIPNKNESHLLTALDEAGVLFRGPDSDHVRNIWGVKFKPRDGRGWFKFKKKYPFFYGVFIRNDYLWEGLEEHKPDIYPSEVSLGLIETKGGGNGKGEMKWIGMMNMPFTPTDEQKKEYEEAEKLKKDNEGKKKIGFSKNNSEWLINEIISLSYMKKVKMNKRGQQYFLSKDHLVVVFPKILEVMSRMDMYNDYVWPPKSELANQSLLIFDHIYEHEKIEKLKTGKVQRKFKAVINGKELPELRGIAFKRSKLKNEYLDDIKPIDIEFTDEVKA